MAAGPAAEPTIRTARRPRGVYSTLLVVAALALVAGAYFTWARLTAPAGGARWAPLDSIAAARGYERLARPAPAFTLPTADGGTLALEELRGQVVLLNFWATWCEPCRAEMPELDTLAREFGPRGFQVVGIDVGERPDQVRQFAAELKIAFPLVLDTDGQVYPAYGVMGLPTSYLIDAEGRIRDVHLGVVTRAYLTDWLSRLLATGP
jgi:peroxiredoxin